MTISELERENERMRKCLALMRQYATRMQTQKQPQVIQERLYVLKMTKLALTGEGTYARSDRTKKVWQRP